MVRHRAMFLALAACGRVGFSAQPDGAIGSADVGPVVPVHPVRDAAASDGVTAPEPCPPFAVFCDGFESGDVSKWTATVMPGTLAVGGAEVHSGHYALDADVPQEGGNGAEGAVELELGAPATGTLAVREYVYAAQPIIDYIGTLFLTDSGNPNGEYAEVIADDVGHWAFTEESSPAGLHDHSSTVSTATGTWTCVELVVDLGSSNTFSIFIDGTQALTAPFLDPHPTYDTIAVGVTRANAAGFEDFVDDVVVAHQRIGC